MQPIGTLTSIDKNIITHTSDYLSIFFDLETVVLPSIEDSFIPESARRMREERHEQPLTGFILNHLQTKIPEDAIVIRAITPKDLYTAENWNFVFGQARICLHASIAQMLYVL